MAEYSRPSSLSQVQSLFQTSEEGEEEQSHQNSPPFIRSIKPKLALNNGSATRVEGTNRRPCDRPQVSKNKPKPTAVLTTTNGDTGMKVVVLEIATGSDVIDTVVQFGRRHQLGGVTIINASVSVFNVTLYNPISHVPSLTLYGQQGHVLGGVVSDNVTTVNKVVLVVATFMNPSFHRLPGADLVVHDGGDDHGNAKLSGASHYGGSAGRSEGCSNTSISISGHGVSSPAPLNSLASSDVVT